MPQSRLYWSKIGNLWESSGYPNLDLDDGFVDDVTKPIWKGTGHPDNNVGCKFGVARTTVSSVAQAPDKIHQNLNITGKIDITQPRQKFINCRGTFSYTGDQGGGVFYQMASITNNQRTEFRFCEIEPTVPGDRYNGIYGHDYLLYRSAITKTVDGTGIYNTTASTANVELSCSWLGWCAWVPDDYNPGARVNGHSDGSGTHNDIVGQHGSGTNVKVHGCFLQGAKFNALNPDNVIINDDQTYTISVGNGIEQMSESNPTEKYGPWAGQGFLSQHSAYFHVGDIQVYNNWWWNFNNGIKFMSHRTASVSPEFTSGNSPITNISVYNNVFGGRWKNWGGSHKYYPFRADINCVVNGTTRAVGAYDDTFNNVWDNGPATDLIAKTYGDTGTNIQGNPVRLRIDTAT